MIRVVNRSRSTILANRAAVASAFSSRLRGLTFRDEFPGGANGLILTPCKAVHTLFMRFCIDVIFLDKNRQAVCCVQNVSPRQLLVGPGNSQSVLELPAGTIESSGTRPRDAIAFAMLQEGLCLDR